MYYPPDTRFQDIQSPGVSVGVVGGIPTRSHVVNVAMLVGNTAAQNQSAFLLALASSAEHDILLIPAGNFLCDPLVIPYNRRNLTIRGAGMSLTRIQCAGYVGMSLGEEVQYWATDLIPITGGLTRGSNTLTLADGTGLPSTQTTAQIALTNEGVTPVCAVKGENRVRTISVLVTGRSGNTVTLSQNILSTFPAEAVTGATLQFADAGARTLSGTGVEDLTVDCAVGGATRGIQLTKAANCWLKNVGIVNVSNYPFFISDCVSCEMRGCRVVGPSVVASNHSGVLSITNTYCLIEDNAVVNNFPEFEINFGTTWCVIAYNYIGHGAFYEGGMLNENHGPHNSYNLFEGNSYNHAWADGYFGSVSEHTHFRNHIRNSNLLSRSKRFARNFNLIGNVCGVPGATGTDGSEKWGEPNLSNSSFDGYCSLLGIGGHGPSVDWDAANGHPYWWTGTLTTRTDETHGVITLGAGQAASFNAGLAKAVDYDNGFPMRAMKPNPGGNGDMTVSSVVGNNATVILIAGALPVLGTAITIYPSQSGFQEFDRDVQATYMRVANYLYVTGALDFNAPDTLPPSYFRSSKPAFFGTLAWPPYNSLAPAAYDGTEIPAGYRFINGVEVPGVEVPGEIIPAERLSVNGWEPGVAVGVPGGIFQYLDGSGHANERPTSGAINVANAPYSADRTGATDAWTPIKSAVDAVSTNGVVYLPPGLYKHSGSGGLGYKDSYTIRGASSPKISGSSVAIGTGTKVFEVMAGGPWVADVGILIRKWDNPGIYMIGMVVSYSGTTLTVNVTSTGGIGTFSMWRVGVSTVLCTGSSGFTIGSLDNDYNYMGAGSEGAIESGYEPMAAAARGANTVTPTDASTFSVGQMIQVRLADETDEARIAAGAAPVVNYGGPNFWLRYQLGMITAKVGSVLTIDPPLLCDYPSALSPRVHSTSNVAKFVGIEHLDMVGVGSTSARPLIAFELAYASWAYDCDAQLTPNYQIGMNTALKCEVRKSIAGGRLNYPGGSNGAGMLLTSSTACLVDDNNFFRNFPGIEVNGNTGCAVLFNNFTEDGTAGIQLNTNHGAHNSFNLYEGNLVTDFKSDGYFGSVSNDTILRNWMVPYDVYGGIGLRRYSTYHNIVGNVLGVDGGNDSSIGLGQPDITSANFNGHCNLANGVLPRHWKGALCTLTTRTGDFEGTFTLTDLTVADFQHPNYLDSATYPVHLWHTSNTKHLYNGTMSSFVGSSIHIAFPPATGHELPAVGSTMRLWPGTYGFQEWSDDVYRIEDGGTTLQRGNYLIAAGVGAQETNLGGEPVPNSLAYSGRPSWWPELTWPPVNPASPTFDVAILPAGYRWIHGEDPAPSTIVATPTFSPAAGAYSMPLVVAMNCATPGAAIHYTTNGTLPTAASPLYSAPITLTIGTTINAIGIKAGLDDSFVSTGAYAMIAAAAVPALRSARAPLYAIST